MKVIGKNRFRWHKFLIVSLCSTFFPPLNVDLENTRKSKKPITVL